LLWLWRRLAATAPIQPLAWEPPYAAGAAQEIATATTTKDKKTKDKKKKKKKKKAPSKAQPSQQHNWPGLFKGVKVTGTKTGGAVLD